MLNSFAIVLFVLWVTGLWTGLTMHGFIHAFIVVAIIMALISLMSDRKPAV
jgi:hypothetical protein